VDVDEHAGRIDLADDAVDVADVAGIDSELVDAGIESF